jgi:hypothetical protein
VLAGITPTLPSPIKGEVFTRSGKPSPIMGEGWEGVSSAHEHAHRPHRGRRYQVTSATTPISIAKA